LNQIVFCLFDRGNLKYNRRKLQRNPGKVTMSQSTSHTKPTIGRTFSIQWILGNSLAWGLGAGLPIIIADLLSPKNYTGYVVTAIMAFGVWVGFAQWMILRRTMPIPTRWITMTAVVSPLATWILTLTLFSVFSPLSLLGFVLSPLFLGLGQWWVLRQLFRPCWIWVIVSTIAILVGGAIGGLLGIVFQPALGNPGLPTLLGGLCCGLIYGVITKFPLQRLMHQEYRLDTPPDSTLDVPPNHKAWKAQITSLLVLIPIFIIWFLICPFPSASASSLLPKWLAPIFPLLVTFPYIYLSILGHELGHLLFALANGFDLKYLAIDRWILVRRSEGFTWSRMGRHYSGGFVSAIAQSQQSLNRRLFMVILGGPLVSFLLFCIGAIPLFFRQLVTENTTIWFITFLAVFNLYGAIHNSLPLRIGYSSTDGRRMLDLFQNNLRGQRFAAIHGYGAGLRQGIRPKDVEPGLLDRLLSIPEKSTDHISGLIIAYYVALDQGNLEQAGAYLDRALDIHLYLPEVFRGSLLIEGVYFEAFIRQQADVARQWLEKIQEKALMEPRSILRGEAALLLAEGDREAALTKIDQALASAHRDRFMVGSAIAEIDWLEAMREKAY
jgi:tetratricopeptide (TPR) repeat protein